MAIYGILRVFPIFRHTHFTVFRCITCCILPHSKFPHPRGTWRVALWTTKAHGSLTCCFGSKKQVFFFYPITSISIPMDLVIINGWCTPGCSQHPRIPYRIHQVGGEIFMMYFFEVNLGESHGQFPDTCRYHLAIILVKHPICKWHGYKTNKNTTLYTRDIPDTVNKRTQAELLGEAAQELG